MAGQSGLDPDPRYFFIMDPAITCHPRPRGNNQKNGIVSGVTSDCSGYVRIIKTPGVHHGR
jgi:hypothetical protein